MKTVSAQSASGSHMTDANPEPAAVQASGQYPTSSAPLGGGTTAEPPSDVAREEAPSITVDSARNGSPARAGTTVGKTLPCSACMVVCKWGGRVQRNVPFKLLFRQHDLYNSSHTMAGHMISTIAQPMYT